MPLLVTTTASWPPVVSLSTLKQVRGQAQHHPAARIRPLPVSVLAMGSTCPRAGKRATPPDPAHSCPWSCPAPGPASRLPRIPRASSRAAKGRSRLHHAAPVVKHGQLHNIIPIFRDRAIILNQLRVIQPLLPGPRRQSSSNFSQVKGLALRAVEDNIDPSLIGQMVPVGGCSPRDAAANSLPPPASSGWP